MYFLIRLTSALQTSATVLTFIIIDKIAGRTNMAAQVSLAIIIVLMNLEYTTGGNLWCYQCNTDLTNGHTRECNDPYVPTPYFDLVLCPQNESQNCLKSVIDYGHILVTVRGCVPSREIDGYCQLEEYFQGSSIACSFCEGYACNNQSSIRVFLLHNLAFVLASIAIILYL
ncbi:uncharacterized protein LOC117243546 isoform X1 [Bombus vosnesenskii]|uniref:Uncharacterized protein LOC117243546 isoform X1 n=3 Tax=Pyrobombus TaxID=144703 RepID=A0A6J3LNH1_9HYME|nr:uncharacterized protein LOC117243546 isoform X1 [Bombus vosnesenskii]